MAFGIGLKAPIPRLPEDPAIRSRIYTPDAADTSPHVMAAMGGEWLYAGGFTAGNQGGHHAATAGAFGLDHRKIHASFERDREKAAFTLAQAQRGMSEVGSPAFRERYPSNTMVSRGTIGADALVGLKVAILYREGDALVPVSGRQVGSTKDGVDLETAAGETTTIPFHKIEVALAEDPIAGHASVASALGFSPVSEPNLDELVGRNVSVTARRREHVPYGQPDHRPLARYEGTLKPVAEKPGMFQLAEHGDVVFRLDELGSEQLFVR